MTRASDESKRDRLRRKHIQNYAADVGGFCVSCGTALSQSALKPLRWGDSKCGKCDARILFTELEETTMQVMVNGKKYATEVTGWRRMWIRGDEVFTKRIAEGVFAVLHRLEAAGHGVVFEKVDETRSPEPSIAPASWVVAKPFVPQKLVTVSKPTVQPVTVSQTHGLLDVGAQISKAVQAMSDPESRREALRKAHVAKYSKK